MFITILTTSKTCAIYVKKESRMHDYFEKMNSGEEV